MKYILDEIIYINFVVFIYKILMRNIYKFMLINYKIYYKI